jgi:hypothetical protein
MTICDGSGLLRARSFAFEQLFIVYDGCHDLRWALAALALRSLSALCASGRILLVTLARNVACRRAAVRDVAPADTTVAAGRG